MAENTDPHAPGIYEKDGVQRRANSRSAAVALVFDGFKRVTAPEAEEPEQTEAPKSEAPKSEAPKSEAPKPTPPKSDNKENPKP